jgi:hypothetical protein
MINCYAIFDKVGGYTISVKDKILGFLKLHPICENQQTNDEKIKLSSIVNFMKELKYELLKANVSIFDKTQIIFCLPVEWTEDKYGNDLRALFLKAGWVNGEDHKNRLIFSTFIERFVLYLQINKNNGIKFERERKYLVFYMDNTSVRLTCYQMQSAKELIAVSKKLALSDFLLTPTILDDESIDLSSFNKIVLNKIEKMFTIRQNTNNRTLKNSVLRRLAEEVLRNLDYICSVRRICFHSDICKLTTIRLYSRIFILLR